MSFHEIHYSLVLQLLLLLQLTHALYLPDGSSLQLRDVELQHNISFSLQFYNPHGSILLYTTAQANFSVALSNGRLMLRLANTTNSLQIQTTNLLIPALRYYIEIYGLDIGKPSVRIDGNNVEIGSVGTGVILSGTSILTIGDTSALVQVLMFARLLFRVNTAFLGSLPFEILRC